MPRPFKEQPFSVEEARRLLAYDPETGLVSWRDSSNRSIDGQEAGSLNARGYRMIKVRGHNVLTHKMAWFLHHGVWPMSEVDHRDRCRTNNAINNLRIASHSQNAANKLPRGGINHGFKGITLSKKSGKWIAQLQARPKSYSLGHFATAEEAARAYDKKAREVFGPFAYLNFP